MLWLAPTKSLRVLKWAHESGPSSLHPAPCKTVNWYVPGTVQYADHSDVGITWALVT